MGRLSLLQTKGHIIQKQSSSPLEMTQSIRKNWSLILEKNNIVVHSNKETSIHGIYAEGDIYTYEGKVKLIASGFREATTAISNTKQKSILIQHQKSNRSTVLQLWIKQENKSK
nr:hypothetical protein [Paenisporosarcina indica]